MLTKQNYLVIHNFHHSQNTLIKFPTFPRSQQKPVMWYSNLTFANYFPCNLSGNCPRTFSPPWRAWPRRCPLSQASSSILPSVPTSFSSAQQITSWGGSPKTDVQQYRNTSYDKYYNKKKGTAPEKFTTDLYWIKWSDLMASSTDRQRGQIEGSRMTWGKRSGCSSA